RRLRRTRRRCGGPSHPRAGCSSAAPPRWPASSRSICRWGCRTTSRSPSRRAAPWSGWGRSYSGSVRDDRPDADRHTEEEGRFRAIAPWLRRGGRGPVPGPGRRPAGGGDQQGAPAGGAGRAARGADAGLPAAGVGADGGGRDRAGAAGGREAPGGERGGADPSGGGGRGGSDPHGRAARPRARGGAVASAARASHAALADVPHVPRAGAGGAGRGGTGAGGGRPGADGGRAMTVASAEWQRDALTAALAEVRRRSSLEPEVALVLGTGLGATMVERLEIEAAIPYEEIPHFPVCTVDSHAGRLLLGRLDGRPVVAMHGRFHRYEGYTLQQIALPIRVMGRLGARTLVLSGACGGMNPLW